MKINKDVSELTLFADNSIKDGLERLNETTSQFLLICFNDNKLQGTITDGDIRRALLRGAALDTKLYSVMNSKPIVGLEEESLTQIKRRMRSRKIRQLPIVDKQNFVKSVCFDEPYHENFNNTFVLMLGGLGTRLKPLTLNSPKPMLKVGNVPLLETIIHNISEQGFNKFIFCINYLGGMIKDYFQDGSKFGISIEYVEEECRLGTVGALSLIDKQLNEPMVVMNGDVLVHLNYKSLLDFHHKHKAKITTCIREHLYQIPYGVVQIDNAQVTSIVEKPTDSYFINAGIYVLEPSLISIIPKNTFYDMPTLILDLIEQQEKVAGYPLTDYWKDIGIHEDFQQANIDYKTYFNKLDGQR